MNANNFSQFNLRVNINTTIEKAYAAWSTSAGLESWFLRGAIFTKENGEVKSKDEVLTGGENYHWFWHGYPDEVSEKSKVLKADGKSLFSFMFSMGCTVTIKFYTECDETIVELIESNLPTDEQTVIKHYVGDSRGWIFYLANLKSVLEGGLDLRNRKMELSNVITS